jgi:hypothetical protein
VSRPHMQATLCAHDITDLVPFGIPTSGVVYGMPPNVSFPRQATATTVTAWTGTDHG